MFARWCISLVLLLTFPGAIHAYEFIVNNITDVKPGQSTVLSWSTTGSVPSNAVVSVVIRNSTLRTVVANSFPGLIENYPPSVSDNSVKLNFDKYANGSTLLSYGWYRIEGAGSVGALNWFFSLTEWFYFGPDPGSSTPLDGSRVQISKMPDMDSVTAFTVNWEHQRTAIPSGLDTGLFKSDMYLYCQGGPDFRFASITRDTKVTYLPPDDADFKDKWCFIDARTNYGAGIAGLNTSNWFYRGPAFANPPSPRPQDSKWFTYNLAAVSPTSSNRSPNPNPSSFPTSSPSVTGAPAPSNSNSSSLASEPKKVNVAAIAGGIIGGLCALLILAFGCLCVRRRKERHRESLDLADEKTNRAPSMMTVPSFWNNRDTTLVPTPLPSPPFGQQPFTPASNSTYTLPSAAPFAAPASTSSGSSQAGGPIGMSYPPLRSASSEKAALRSRDAASGGTNTVSPTTPSITSSSANYDNLTDEETLARELEVLRQLNAVRAQNRSLAAAQPPAYDGYESVA